MLCHYWSMLEAGQYVLLQKGVDCSHIQVDNTSWVFLLVCFNRKNITWSWISIFQHPERYQYQEQGTSVFKFQVTCCSKVCLIPQLWCINNISFLVQQYGLIIEEIYDQMHKTMKGSLSLPREAPPMMVAFGGVCCKNQLLKIMREEEVMPEGLFLVCSHIVPMMSLVLRGVGRSQSGSSQLLGICLCLVGYVFDMSRHVFKTWQMSSLFRRRISQMSPNVATFHDMSSNVTGVMSYGVSKRHVFRRHIQLSVCAEIRMWISPTLGYEGTTPQMLCRILKTKNLRWNNMDIDMQECLRGNNDLHVLQTSLTFTLSVGQLVNVYLLRK